MNRLIQLLFKIKLYLLLIISIGINGYLYFLWYLFDALILDDQLSKSEAISHIYLFGIFQQAFFIVLMLHILSIIMLIFMKRSFKSIVITTFFFDILVITITLGYIFFPILIS